MSEFEIAQLNIASMKAPLESPELADFVSNLDRINRLADQSPGFRWRLETEDGDATAIRPFGSDVLVNLSVWRDIASLHAFVYRTAHAQFLRRRKEWFERATEAYAVLWWVPLGSRPTVDEAKRRLDAFRCRGATAYAFSFRKPYPPTDLGEQAAPAPIPDESSSG